MSLRSHLVAWIAFALLATLLVGSILLYWHARAKVETEMRASIAVGSRIAQNAVDDGDGVEIANPRRRLELLVRDFDGDRHIRATLIDANGLVALVSSLTPPERPVPRLLVRLLDREVDRVSVKLPAQFEGHGTVILESNAMNEIAEVWDDARLYFGLLAVFSVATLMITVATVGRILAPIENLQRAFARFGGGNYEARVAVSGPPELTRLCNGFNEMGERLQDMDDKTHRLREQLDRVQEEERADLARNLHDDLSPLLFSVDVDATMIRQFADAGDVERVLDRATAIRQAVVQMKRQVKSILGRLRPSILVDVGLATALDELAGQWRARHPDVSFDICVPRDSIGPKLDGTLFHIIRESVSNSLRHGHPRTIVIAVGRRVPSAVFLEVADDGDGIDAERMTRGFGIRGMYERTALAGGTLSIQNRHDGKGVRVLGRFPVSDADQRPMTASAEAKVA